ncbi:MAG: YqgE/AlgH family protein [Saprospiraceae bacterium]|nr:MAG: YqgE/AlgH family protein [Saprospiraceae bacterium]
MAKVSIKNGTILLAEPFMLDPNFKRAAVLVCEHNDEGTVGFILSKKLDMQVNELISSFPEFDAPIFFGGPVQTDTIHYVHNVGELLDDSRQVTRGVWWGGDFDKLKFLISSQLIKPDNIRFFVGYSGWSEGQLQEEMSLGSWVVANMHPNYLFKSKPNELWQQIMSNKGDSYSVIATLPDAVTWN